MHTCEMPYLSFPDSAAGIPDNALRLDVHALAGLYSCNIRSFDGYIQSINPGLKCAPAQDSSYCQCYLPSWQHCLSTAVQYLGFNALAWCPDTDLCTAETALYRPCNMSMRAHSTVASVRLSPSADYCSLKNPPKLWMT